MSKFKCTWLITVLLLTSVTVTAQKLRFTNPTNHWYTAGTSTSDACPFSHYITYGADTVMYGVIYKTVHDSMPPPLYILPGCYSGGSSLANMFWVREDTVGNKVYYRYPALDTIEHLLYDYNLSVGDTIHYNQYMSFVTDTVVRIDSILISGVSHRVLTMHGKSSPSPFSRAYSVVEGLGCTGNPWLPAFFPGCFEYFEKDLCFGQGPYTPAITVPYFMCGLHETDTFRNCTYFTLSASKPPLRVQNEHIYPNPARDYVAITLPDTFNGNIQLKVYDQMGKCIYQKENEQLNGIIKLNVLSWPDGLYIVVYEDNFGGIKSGKFEVRK